MRSRDDGQPDDMAIEIIEALDAVGVSPESYRLFDYVDPEALERVVRSLEGEYTISFSVESVTVTIEAGGIDVEAS